MSDPASIAQMFLQAYGQAFATANLAQLASLYGADSVFCLDGTALEGQQAIASGVIGPRFAGGPIMLRIISMDAQLVKPTQNQIVVFVTGESSDRPKGRFSQVFVLNALPTGGFYIKADISRFASQGENVGKDPAGLGKQFLTHYYTTYATNRPALAGIFRPTSTLTFEGVTHDGLQDSGPAKQGILAKVGAAPAPEGFKTLPSAAHQMSALDSVTIVGPAPVGGVSMGVVALVTGLIRLEGETNPLNFAQAFVVVVENGAPFCSNDLFRFHYG